jgi:hypothetical protein
VKQRSKHSEEKNGINDENVETIKKERTLINKNGNKKATGDRERWGKRRQENWD